MQRKKINLKLKWDVYTKHIKGKKRAIGIISKIRSTSRLAASMIELIDKEYFDFNISVDILFKSQGVGGVAFRIRDVFNYYAFIIDKNQGYKAIAKVENSKVTILKMINDGGIIINNWHTVSITVKAGNISVYIYDKESASKTVSEKTIQVEDFTFSRGSIGFFVNGLDGFYFDELKIKPIECYSPWQPIPYLEILNIHTNIYAEDFIGNIKEKYTVVDIEEQNNRDGPSKWDIVNDDIELNLIRQSSHVYDSSPYKRPSIAIINYINFENGIYKVSYNPTEETGMISIIIKYNKDEDDDITTKEEFFSFDIVNEGEENYFTFRKWTNGIVNLIKRYVIDETTMHQMKVGFRTAYIPKALNHVVVEFINNKITIKISQDGENFVVIFNLIEESISSGSVGFGTYKTSADFIGIYVEPPKMELTQRDIDYIMTNTLEDIPMPCVVDIYKTATVSSCSRVKVFTELPALSTVLAYATILGSAIGRDNCSGGSSDTDNSNTISEKSSVETEDDNWKVCVSIRSQQERRRFCDNSYTSDIIKQRCEVKFFKYFF